jgi:hypothetical protein
MFHTPRIVEYSALIGHPHPLERTIFKFSGAFPVMYTGLGGEVFRMVKGFGKNRRSSFCRYPIELY